MTSPTRLRLSRAKGFDLTAHSRDTNGLEAVNVARPGPWGNPFIIGRDGDRSRCVQMHRHLMGGLIAISANVTTANQHAAYAYAEAHLPELTGKNLACWCPLDGGPCHADILLELANMPVCMEVRP
jgi:hypothetical protein